MTYDSKDYYSLMYERYVTLNDVKRVSYVNLEPSGKVMNVEVESRNAILQVKE